MELRSERGQSLVEYILLIAVVISLVLTLYQSAAFRRLFGTQGALGTRMKSQSEFSYRHAYMSRDNVDIDRANREGAIHPSYHDTVNGGTRFFGPKEPYQ
jgi:type II secretory pathway component PulJ